MTKQVQEDSAAQATLRPQNKSAMLSAALQKMAGMSIEDLSHYLNDSLAQIGHEADAIPSGAANANQATLAMKNSVKEDLAVVFGEGETLSEELKENVSTLFESALEARLVMERESLLEEMNTQLDEAYEAIAEEMADKIDAYLDNTIGAWLEENAVAIESALKNDLAESFMDGLKNLFTEHYMNIPEDQVDVVEALVEEVNALEERLDETIMEAKVLKDQLSESTKKDLVNSMCEGLALTSSEKLRSLIETVEFTGDVADFQKKINVIKESVTSPASTNYKTGILTEESDPNAPGTQEAAKVAPEVARYMSAISRSVRLNQ